MGTTGVMVVKAMRQCTRISMDALAKQMRARPPIISTAPPRKGDKHALMMYGMEKIAAADFSAIVSRSQ